jgi:hypothetical protein
MVFKLCRADRRSAIWVNKAIYRTPENDQDRRSRTLLNISRAHRFGDRARDGRACLRAVLPARRADHGGDLRNNAFDVRFRERIQGIEADLFEAIDHGRSDALHGE